MLVIQKKRIQIILLGILTSIFVFTFQIAENKQESNNNTITNENDAVQVTSTPVSGKTIIIDAGHGTPDEGDCLLKFVV